MAVPLNFTQIIQAQLAGYRDFTLKIYQQDTITPLLSEVVYTQMGSASTWKYNSLVGGKIEKGLMGGYLQLQLVDVGKALFLYFSEARTNGAEDGNFYFELGRAGVQLEGRIRVNKITTLEAHWTEIPVLSIRLYDGTGKVDELQKLLVATQSLTSFFQNALWGTLARLEPLHYRCEFDRANGPAGETVVDMLLTGTPYYEYYPNRQFKKIITLGYELLAARVWQGLDNIWHIEQPHLMGQPGQVIVDPIFGFRSIEPAVANVRALSRTDLEGGVTRSLMDPIAAVTIKRKYRDKQWGDGTIFSNVYEINLLRAGGFDNVWNQALDHWDLGGLAKPTALDPRGRGTSCLRLEPPEGVQQDGMWMNANQEFQLLFNGYYALEDQGAGGNQSAFIQFFWEPWNPVVDPVFYLDATGAWTQTPTFLATPATGMDGSGANPLTWHNWFVAIRQQSPTLGRLRVALLGSSFGAGGAAYNIFWDDVQLHPCNVDADDGTGKPAKVEGFELETTLYAYDATTGEPLQGRTLKLEHEIPHVSYVQLSTSGALDSIVLERYEFNNFDSGNIPNRWQVNKFTYRGKQYVDPVEMLFDYYRDVLGTYHWQLSGKMCFPAPPELAFSLDDVPFFQTRSSLDLWEGTSEGKWVESKIGSQLFLDLFEDTDGTNLLDHTPDYDRLGGGWLIQGGTWEIEGGGAYKAAGGTDEHVAVADVGWPDVKVESKVLWYLQGRADLVVRRVGNTWIEGTLQLTAFRIRVWDGAAATTIATGSTPRQVADGEEITVILESRGNQITYTCVASDFTLQISAESDYNQTATQHGLRNIVQGTSGRHLDVEISALYGGFTPTPAPSTSFPLDALTEAPTGVYALQRMLSSYQGNCIRVRRSSDDALLDIPFFPNGALDILTLLGHVGAGEGYVETWYDQSGGGNDRVAASNAAQPRIVNAGVIETNPDGDTCLIFDGTDDQLDGAGVTVTGIPFETVVIFHSTQTGTNNMLWSIADNSEAQQQVGFDTDSGAAHAGSPRMWIYPGSFIGKTGNNNICDGDVHLAIGRWLDTTDRVFRVDQANEVVDSVSGSFPTGIDRESIGGMVDSTPGQWHNGGISLVINFDAALGVDDLALIEALKPNAMFDKFHGTNGDGIDGRTPDVGTGTWEETVGTWQIQNNRAERTSSGNQEKCTIDVGISDYVLDAQLIFGSDMGIVVRHDGTDYFVVVVTANTQYLFEYDGATYTIVDSITLPTPAPHNVAGDVINLKITCQGQTITSELTTDTGTYQVQGTGLSRNETETRVGIRENSTGTKGAFEYIRVTAI